MGINFHHEKNRNSYTTRKADRTWMEAIQMLVPIHNVSQAVDIGCGGGIYSKALSDLGVHSITGVDYSEVILDGAREKCRDYPNISFVKGDALQTNLPSERYDVVLERALIHHIKDLESCFKEAHRLLKGNGVYLIQDRTPEDCLVEGSNQHIRGYFFSSFPKLIEKEVKRRHSSEDVQFHLRKMGFREIEEMKIWEIRNTYDHKEQLLNDLRSRTGRSILHELDDQELNDLVNDIDENLPTNPIIEKDRWTIWKAVK